VPAVVDPDGVELATIRELVDLSGLRVLDVGCGEGRLSFECAREGAEVFAFDPREIELPKGEFELALFSWSL